MPTVAKNTDLLTNLIRTPKTENRDHKFSDNGFAETLRGKAGHPKLRDPERQDQLSEVTIENEMVETTLSAKSALSELLSRGLTKRNEPDAAPTIEDKSPFEGSEKVPTSESLPAIEPEPKKVTIGEDDSLKVESLQQESSSEQTLSDSIDVSTDNLPRQAKVDGATAIPLIISNAEMPGLRIMVREVRKMVADSEEHSSLSSLIERTTAKDAIPLMPKPSEDIEQTPEPWLNREISRPNQRPTSILSQGSDPKLDLNGREQVKIDVVLNQSIPAPQRIGDTTSGLLQQLASQLAKPATATGSDLGTHPVQTNVSSATHMLKVNLNPAELGAVVASLHLNGSQLKVAIQTDTVEAYRQLSVDSDALVKALQSMGYDVDRVTVQPPQAMQQSLGRADAAQAGPGDFSSRGDAQFTSQQGRSNDQTQQENRSPFEREASASNERSALSGDASRSAQLASSDRYI